MDFSEAPPEGPVDSGVERGCKSLPPAMTRPGQRRCLTKSGKGVSNACIFFAHPQWRFFFEALLFERAHQGPSVFLVSAISRQLSAFSKAQEKHDWLNADR
jgi:hypothetical protein